MASVDELHHRQLNYGEEEDQYDDEDYQDQIEMAQEALMGEADEADHEIE
jgi:hypothetical protein